MSFMSKFRLILIGGLAALLIPIAVTVINRQSVGTVVPPSRGEVADSVSLGTVAGSEVVVPVSSPRTMIIPKLNIEADIEYVGEDENGRMDVPQDDFDVAWWKFGAKPGEVGNSVLAGHLDRKDGGPAVFYQLGKLESGDIVQVVDEEGNMKEFNVVAKETYQDANFPLDEVFGASSQKRLNLITCSGVFDRSNSNYSDRLVVYTQLQED